MKKNLQAIISKQIQTITIVLASMEKCQRIIIHGEVLVCNITIQWFFFVSDNQSIYNRCLMTWVSVGQSKKTFCSSFKSDNQNTFWSSTKMTFPVSNLVRFFVIDDAMVNNSIAEYEMVMVDQVVLEAIWITEK